MRSVAEDVLSQIVGRLVEAIEPVEIWLFGSQASGKAHKDSDVDLMVVVPDGSPDAFELARRGYPALAGLRIPAELHFVREGELDRWRLVKFSLAFEATHRGRLIYGISTGASVA